MAPGEVIDLLSTDDEAPLQPPRASKGVTIANGQLNSDFLILPDDFDGTTLSKVSSKRRKLSPLLSGEDYVPRSPRLPVTRNRFLSPKATSRCKAQATQEWAPIDGSDPIVFTSSLGGGTPASRTNRRAFDAVPSHDQGSDDSLPEDLLSAPIRKSDAASALSERTAALLASLSQPPPRAKPSNARKPLNDKTASRINSRLQGSIDREDSTGHEDKIRRSSEDVTAPKKRKLTEEERVVTAQEKEREKAAKAREREKTKAFGKEQKAKEKQEELERKRIQKEEKAREKRIATDLAEVNKSKLDKKDSTPEMIVDLPASIDGQSVETQIKEFLKNLGVHATLYQSPIPNIIRWRRKMKARWNAEMDHWEPIGRMEIHEEKHVMCLVSAKEFVELAMVQNSGEDVETHVTKLKCAYEGCIPIYMIEGLHIWMRKNRTAENRAYQERVNSLSQSNADGVPAATSRKKKPAPEVVDEDMIEDALLRLQVMNGCLIHHTNTSVETAEWVANFTQHISTIPYRSAVLLPILSIY